MRRLGDLLAPLGLLALLCGAWEAACRLEQTATYWPTGTVFVSVVDPGVGTERRSIVAKSKNGQYFVTPDNGTLTLIASSLGIESIRRINESINRRTGSGESYTFHGRDVCAYTAARLASGAITYEQVGELLDLDSLILIPYTKPGIKNNEISGTIPVLDVQYGNVWTNIPDSLIRTLKINAGDSIQVQFYFKDSLLVKGNFLFANTFGEVATGKTLCYLNSLMNLSFAINEGNFSDSFHIGSGPNWKVIARRSGGK